LIGDLGGPETPGVGWAAGVERLAMLLAEPEDERPNFAIVVENDDLASAAIQFARAIRGAGYSAAITATGSAKKRFEKATRLANPDYAAVFRESDLSIRPYAKYPRIRVSESSLVPLLPTGLPAQLNLEVHETWHEMKVRHASDGNDSK
jgi:histidyl-tRNA synthetase